MEITYQIHNRHTHAVSWIRKSHDGLSLTIKNTKSIIPMNQARLEELRRRIAEEERNHYIDHPREVFVRYIVDEILSKVDKDRDFDRPYYIISDDDKIDFKSMGLVALREKMELNIMTNKEGPQNVEEWEVESAFIMGKPLESWGCVWDDGVALDLEVLLCLDDTPLVKYAFSRQGLKPQELPMEVNRMSLVLDVPIYVIPAMTKEKIPSFIEGLVAGVSVNPNLPQWSCVGISCK
jgi:hypothetical protein